MNYLYTINLYKNDDEIHPEEYVVVNGKMLIAVIDNILMEKYIEDEQEDGGILVLSTAVRKLFKSHDLFTNIILSDLFATTDCVDGITGDVKEGFKLIVKVEEDE